MNMKYQRQDGYEGPGTRQNEWYRILPPINTAFMVLCTTMVGLAIHIYLTNVEISRKTDENIYEQMVILLNKVDTRFDKFDQRMEEFKRESYRLVEKNDDDKKDIRQKLADLGKQCCRRAQ